MTEAMVLTRREVRGLMSAADYLQAVKDGFKAASEGRARSPSPMAIDGSGGSFHAKGASLELDRHYVALKFNGNFPDNPARFGLPTIQGAILLCDGETGSLLAIIDSIEVTLRRTAAATALAAQYLARPQSSTLLICGAGEQGAAHVAALREVLPLTRALVWDRDAARASALASRTSVPGFAVASTDDLASAAAASDVIVTCTTSTQPFLDGPMIGPGTFVAAVGADSPSKSEIFPALMAKSLVVADVTEQCVAMGDISHAIRAGAIGRDDIHAELADLVAGTKPGRTDANQVTLFDSTGTAIQDVATAALLYQRAKANPGHLVIGLGNA